MSNATLHMNDCDEVGAARLDVADLLKSDVRSEKVQRSNTQQDTVGTSCCSIVATCEAVVAAANIAMPDPTLLLPSPPDSGVEVIWGKSRPCPMTIVPHLDVYRESFFEQPHDVFFGVAKDPLANGLFRHLVCCVKRNNENGLFDGIFIGDRDRL